MHSRRCSYSKNIPDFDGYFNFGKLHRSLLKQDFTNLMRGFFFFSYFYQCFCCYCQQLFWPYNQVNPPKSEKPSCLWRTRVSAAASFVSSTTVAIISCWQKRNFQDHRGKRRWQGKQGGVVMYPSRYHLHLLLHVRVLLCCNWPYSRFNPACHHPLLEHISSPRLSLSLRRMLHEEHF